MNDGRFEKEQYGGGGSRWTGQGGEVSFIGSPRGAKRRSPDIPKDWLVLREYRDIEMVDGAGKVSRASAWAGYFELERRSSRSYLSLAQAYPQVRVAYCRSRKTTR